MVIRLILHILWTSLLSSLQPSSQIMEIVQGTKDTLETHKSWYLIQPVQQEYNGLEKPANIEYSSIDLHCKTVHLDTLQPGTWIFATTPLDGKIENISLYPVTFVVVRSGNGYLDYLRELHNVPFTLPPRRYNNGHQTDLRIGTDCAEMAIYGMRRMGHDIPYVGPKRIDKYCSVVDSIAPGDLIHFHDQVSILFKDHAPKGIFNPDDILIHARPDGVVIEKWEDSEFAERDTYRILRWQITPIDR